MAKVSIHGKLKVFDGTGTKTRPMSTGQGAPDPIKAGRGVGKILPNNWGSMNMKKLEQGPSNPALGDFYTQAKGLARSRFEQPVGGDTKQIPSGVGPRT